MSNLQSGASKAQIIELLSSIKQPIMGAGGGFAPIGTENYFEGTTAPVGWVICDGSVLNIADYPELATYYASHYGASNHFGGDGVTTFAVPTRSGMPYSNEGYSTSEKIIGVNNNRKPIYRKHITGLSVSLTSADSWQNLTSISGADSLIDLKMYHYFSEMGFLQVYTRESELYDTIDCMILVKGLIGVNRIVTDVIAEYTKGADSAVSLGHSADGNGVFCVKASLSDANLDAYTVYSPNERQVGWWQEEVDGMLKQKPRYRKTVNGLSVSVPKNDWGTTTIDFGLTNSEIKIVSGSCINDNGECPGLYYGKSGTNRISILNLRNGGNSETITSVTLEYIKTTDQWQMV